ncbi:MAG: ABC transporter permease [Eubacteriales bacterium]|nr:ABC transporter permease [Eubacteriales bacterium]
MSKFMYPKLAFQNIRKNKTSFFPFALAGIFMVAMFYMLHTISIQADDRLFMGARTMRKVLSFGLYVVGFLSVIVLFYTDRFLIKQRAKEFGLYSLLGMEKKHIAKVVKWELIYVGGAIITIGVGLGVLFSKLMFLLLLNIIGVKTNFAFRIVPSSIMVTAGLFGITMLVILVANAISVYRLKPIDLMQSSRAGECEPKAKWLLAVLGVISLGIGYYLAQTANNPVEAMGFFFIAVLCVIVGTYLLFLTGSIAILKLVKKSKKLYYHKKRFITISGMMYRMKQNAVGLANICILSTAVLVVLSSTVSLYTGIEDILDNIFKKNVIIEYLYERDRDEENSPSDWINEHHYDYDAVTSALEERAKTCDVQIQDMEQYYILSELVNIDGNEIHIENKDYERAAYINVITVDDYNRMKNTNYALEQGQVFLDTDVADLEHAERICITGCCYEVAEHKDLGVSLDRAYISSIGRSITMVVPSLDDLRVLRNAFTEEKNEYGSTDVQISICYYMMFNLSGSKDDKLAFVTELRDYINKTGIAHLSQIDDVFSMRPEVYGIYGGMFFIGLFLGGLFLVITVMIIYYKQLSEGYDDRERFQIMQKVGMGKREVKSVIRSQILQVFFLPLLLAMVHIGFAFKIIKDILHMMEFTNDTSFIASTIGTIGVFSLLYYITYMLTARTYYKITSQ